MIFGHALNVLKAYHRLASQSQTQQKEMQEFLAAIRQNLIQAIDTLSHLKDSDSYWKDEQSEKQLKKIIDFINASMIPFLPPQAESPKGKTVEKPTWMQSMQSAMLK